MRGERLTQLYLELSSGGTVTATALAETLGVSKPTVHRDIERLRSAGVPIRGTTNVGYSLGDTPEVPPLLLTREELVALIAGAKAAGPANAEASRSLLDKVRALIPPRSRKKYGL
jgi:predicted DNA-binding transcriptional regulator YafY